MKKRPDKSKLRTGFTTGACATAAAQAACEMLASGREQTRVRSILPNGKAVWFDLQRHELLPNGGVTCSVIKDAGDDPDCTDGAHLTATVHRTATPGIRLLGGDGVGTITQPGLGLEVGSAAINPVPRRTLLAAISQALGDDIQVEVTLSVPGGEEMATHTLNARLGIVGGISILGTTGIVRPYSTAAFKASVEQGIQVAASQGATHIAITTGGRSEKFARALLPELPETAFVQMGDFVGFALTCAAKNAIATVSIVGMIGKLSKLADGRRQTHASGSQVNTALLGRLVKSLGAPKALVSAIAEANTGRHALELAERAGYPGLAAAICQRAARYGSRFAGDGVTVQVLMTDFDGNLQGRHPAPG